MKKTLDITAYYEKIIASFNKFEGLLPKLDINDISGLTYYLTKIINAERNNEERFNIAKAMINMISRYQPYCTYCDRDKSVDEDVYGYIIYYPEAFDSYVNKMNAFELISFYKYCQKFSCLPDGLHEQAQRKLEEKPIVQLYLNNEINRLVIENEDPIINDTIMLLEKKREKSFGSFCEKIVKYFKG